MKIIIGYRRSINILHPSTMIEKLSINVQRHSRADSVTRDFYAYALIYIWLKMLHRRSLMCRDLCGKFEYFVCFLTLTFS